LDISLLLGYFCRVLFSFAFLGKSLPDLSSKEKAP
jgi:hypothetical protein